MLKNLIKLSEKNCIVTVHRTKTVKRSFSVGCPRDFADMNVLEDNVFRGPESEPSVKNTLVIRNLLSISSFNKIVTTLQTLVGDFDYIRFFQRKRTSLGYMYVVFRDNKAAAHAKQSLLGKKFINKVLGNTDVQWATFQGVRAVHNRFYTVGGDANKKFLYVHSRVQHLGADEGGANSSYAYRKQQQ